MHGEVDMSATKITILAKRLAGSLGIFTSQPNRTRASKSNIVAFKVACRPLGEYTIKRLSNYSAFVQQHCHW